MAHKSEKLQSEIVAVLCLLALFTHVHLFWVVGLLLALIDMPDFATPLTRIAGSLEKIAGITQSGGQHKPIAGTKPGEDAASMPNEPMRPSARDQREPIDA
jgi:hypothetical protein